MTNQLKEALEEIADPISFMRKRLNEGEQLNGQYAIMLSNDASHLKEIARKALASYNQSPSTGEQDDVDEMGNDPL